jgi:tol-pal system protein YbgF
MKKLIILFFLILFSCSSTKDPYKYKNEKVIVYKEDKESIQALKATIDDLNNKIFILKEQLESLLLTSNKNTPKNKPLNYTNDNSLVKEEELKAYNRAYKYFNDKKYSKSLVFFSSFINDYKNSILLPSAIFWIAESYYMQKEYKLALKEYLKIIDSYNSSVKVPESFFKISKIYLKLGETSKSKTYLKELKLRFPNSYAAKKIIKGAL